MSERQFKIDGFKRRLSHARLQAIENARALVRIDAALSALQTEIDADLPAEDATTVRDEVGTEIQAMEDQIDRGEFQFPQN